MAKRDRGGGDGEAPAPFNNPFGGLAGKLGMTPEAAPDPRAPSPRPPARPEYPGLAPPRPAGRAVGAPPPLKSQRHCSTGLEPFAPARAVVRLERKGRGGKEATVVEKLGLAPAQAERWVKELKASLGCGGAVEGDALVLQGDQRERVKALLERRGVRKVTLG
jgi:translation initiation factor 1